MRCGSQIATDIAEVAISVSGVSLAGARCHLTDSVRTYTEVPLDLCGDGTAVILQIFPNFTPCALR